MRRVQRRLIRAIANQRVTSVLVFIGYLIATIGSVTVLNTQKAGAGSVAYKSSATSTSQNSNTITINKPTGTLENHVMIAAISVIGNNATITAPAGWTSINKATNGTEIATEAFWKRAGASEGTNYAFTSSINNTQLSGGIATYTGVSTASSPIGNQGADGSGSGTTLTAPVVNIGTARSKAIAVFASEDEANTTHTPPSGMLERFDIATTRSGVGNRDATTSVADILRATTGNFGANSATAANSNVYVAFQFELLADSVVHMLLFWEGTNAPTGWSYVDDANDLYIRGDEPNQYGTTGGNATHAPSVSSVTTANGTPADVDSGGQTPQGSTAGHTHPTPANPTIGSANNLPQFRTLKLIRYDAGITNTIPSGAIAIFDGSPGIPGSGWTRISAQDTYFVRADDAIATGGNTNSVHTHTIDHQATLNAASGSINRASFLASIAVADPSHTHTITDTGFTTATNGTDPCDVSPIDDQCYPPYVNSLFASANSDTPTISVGFAAMFDGDPGGGWVVRSGPDPDGGGSAVAGPFYQKFMRGASSYDENCGQPPPGDQCGATSHQHTAANITSGQASATSTDTRNLVGNAMARQTHTHVITTNFSTVSNVPQYFSVVVGEKVNLILTDYVWYLDNDLLTPTNQWGNPDNGEHTAIIVLPLTTEDPPELGDELRLRVKVAINGNDLAASTITLKLQYNATKSSLCTVSTGTWTDVGNNSDTNKEWRYAASSVSDGTSLWVPPANDSVFTTPSTVAGNYIKSSSYGTNPYAAVIGETVEFDFHIEDYSAEGATQFSFRVLEANGTLLSQYDYCPTLTTMPRTENQLRHGNYFETDRAGDSGVGLEGGFSWND